MNLLLRVLGDRVLVRPDVNANAPETLASGVVVAKSLAAAVTGHDETLSVSRGTVIAVGQPRHPYYHESMHLADKLDRLVLATPSSTNAELYTDAAKLLRDLVRKEPSVGLEDDVLFSHDAGQQITMDGETSVILHDHEILAVVEPETAPAVAWWRRGADG